MDTMTPIRDPQTGNSFYLLRVDWEWAGYIHHFERDLPTIRHTCDVNGIEYASPKPGVLYLFAHRGSKWPVFEEFVDFLRKSRGVKDVYRQEVSLQ